MTDLAPIRIPVDNSQVVQAATAAQRLESRIVLLEKSLRSGRITSGQYNAELGRQAKALRDLGMSYNEANSQVRKFAAGLRGLGSAELNNLNRGIDASQKGFRRFELGVQQAGYQIGDFAVQVASGTNPLVAFSQQATQLVSFFGGPWGAAAGAAIAVVSGLIIAFQGMSEAAEQAKKEAANLTDVLSMLEEITDRLNLSIDETIDRYGVATGSVREFAVAQAESALAQAEQRLGDQLLILDATTQKYTEAANAANYLNEALDYSDVLRTIREDFDGIGTSAMALHEAFVALDNATTFAGQRVALLEIDRILSESGIHARDLPPELNRALFELRSLVEEADRLAAAMDRVKSASRQMTYGRIDALSGLTGSQLIPPPAPLEDPDKTDSSKTKKQSPLERLQQQIKLERELIGTTEAYQKVRRALGDDFAKTDPKIISNLIQQINETEKLIEVEKQRERIMNSVSNSLEKGFMSMVDGTSSVKDAFKSMAAEIIKELYRVFVVQRMVNSLMGFFSPATATTTSFGTPNFFGGGRASGGSIMPNRPYLVGEHGPELVIPRHSGTVVNANQTAGAMSGGGDITVQNNITVTGSDAAMVRAEVAKMIPQITNATKAAVIDAKQRGGQMAAAFR